jgi:tetratricopeptide (TPR) repeat protein
MRILRFIVIVPLLLFLAAAGGLSQTPSGGLDSPLRFGVGARELGLGGSAIATCDPATAPVWNPSRLAGAQYYSVTGFHTRLFDSDVAYQYLGATVPTLDYGVLGLGIVRLGVDNIEKRDAGNVLTGMFSDTRLGIFAGYGRTIGSYDLGIAVNLEHHSLDTYTATSTPGLAVSVSRAFGRLTDLVNELDVTLSVTNLLAPSTEIGQESISQPAAADLGISAHLLKAHDADHQLVLSGRISKTEQIDPALSGGLEYSYAGLVSIRGGLRSDYLSAGAGLAYRWLQFDYAFVNRDLGALHMFSITTAFGTSVDERLERREERRENEFNRKMNLRLSNRSEASVDTLVSSGRKALSKGDLHRAVTDLDRALFLAVSTGMDTLEIAGLLSEANERLLQHESADRFSKLIDSARACFDRRDYIAARYLAGRALDIEAESNEAASLVFRCDSLLAENMARSELIQAQLDQIDSLLVYGHYRDALALAASLEETAPDNKDVQRVLVRARFEQVRHHAEDALGRGDYAAVRADLERAEQLVPRHRWTEEMRRQVAQVSTTTAKLASPPDKPPSRLSESMARQVEEIYRSAQAAFEAGNLEEAIGRWERVEQLAPGYNSVRDYLVKAYKYLGVEFYGQNQLTAAIDKWRRAAELAPDNAEIKSYIKRAENEIARLRELSYESEQ